MIYSQANTNPKLFALLAAYNQLLLIHLPLFLYPFLNKLLLQFLNILLFIKIILNKLSVWASLTLRLTLSNGFSLRHHYLKRSLKTLYFMFWPFLKIFMALNILVKLKFYTKFKTKVKIYSYYNSQNNKKI